MTRKPSHPKPPTSTREDVFDRPTAEWLERAVDLFRRRDLHAADQALDQHLARAPQSWTGLCLKAILAAETHREVQAEQIWLQLVERNPAYAEGHTNLGLMYKRMGRVDEAEAHLRKALSLSPDLSGAHHNLGMVLMDRDRMDDALAAFERALELEPNAAQTRFNIGVLWQGRMQFDRACAAYRETLRLAPSHQGAMNNLVFCLQYLPDCAPETRLAVARELGQTLCASVTQRSAWNVTFEPSRRLRVGFVSGDLRTHPVGYFLETLFRGLGETSLEFHAYSNHPTDDELSARLRARFAGWHHVDTWNDEALEARIVADGIDVLIDLAGHSALNRLPLFARRPAPVQMSWLGYFATTGLPTMDWVLADPVCVPPGEEKWFVEKVERLPHTRLCFAPPANAPQVSPLPAATAEHFTFGCFQDLAKINDEVLALWAQVLAACPHAILRLQSAPLTRPEPRERFVKRLLDAGISAAQLRLFGSVARESYFASYGEVDVVLDTFPYPGGTTTCEALWMGVPTLTLAQPGMLGRQGEGLLAAVGLTDWVARSKDQYLTKAIRAASPDPRVRKGLAELRAGLRDHLVTTPVFDARRFAMDWESAIRRIWNRRCNDA
jgi:protein O-GlcNAc transferase